jgi:hypothetical protein
MHNKWSRSQTLERTAHVVTATLQTKSLTYTPIFFLQEYSAHTEASVVAAAPASSSSSSSGALLGAPLDDGMFGASFAISCAVASQSSFIPPSIYLVAQQRASQLPTWYRNFFTTADILIKVDQRRSHQCQWTIWLEN